MKGYGSCHSWWCITIFHCPLSSKVQFSAFIIMSKWFQLIFIFPRDFCVRYVAIEQFLTFMIHCYYCSVFNKCAVISSYWLIYSFRLKYFDFIVDEVRMLIHQFLEIVREIMLRVVRTKRYGVVVESTYVFVCKCMYKMLDCHYIYYFHYHRLHWLYNISLSWRETNYHSTKAFVKGMNYKNVTSLIIITFLHAGNDTEKKLIITDELYQGLGKFLTPEGDGPPLYTSPIPI